MRSDDSDELFSELERMAESCVRYGVSAVDALGALVETVRITSLVACVRASVPEVRSSGYVALLLSGHFQVFETVG